MQTEGFATILQQVSRNLGSTRRVQRLDGFFITCYSILVMLCWSPNNLVYVVFSQNAVLFKDRLVALKLFGLSGWDQMWCMYFARYNSNHHHFSDEDLGIYMRKYGNL